MKILLSIGHSLNGKDKGAVAHNGATEGQLNHDLVHSLKDYLLKNYEGVSVDIKEEKNSNAKFQIYNRSGYDLAISIHHNSFSNISTGTEVFYKSDMNKEFASNLSQALSKCIKINNRGAKKKDLYILNIGFDILIEPCFISNPSDFDEDYDRNKMAKIIGKQIGEKYNMTEKIKQDNTADNYAKESVKKAIDKGILLGDTNGDLKLHSGVTRQELMVFLDRLNLL